MQVNIGSGNGLLLFMHHAIAWTIGSKKLTQENSITNIT